MRIIEVEQNTDEWIEARKGKITGSKLADIIVKRGTGRKIGFYQLIADKLAIEPDDEDCMDRGHRLEDEALKLFASETGKKIEQVGLCLSDSNDCIALSPDGLIKNGKKYTEAVECKCLGSARHLEAIIENKIPSDYYYQTLQYFIVNDDLETLHFVFYDPRIICKPYHCIDVKREEVSEDIKIYKEYQTRTLEEINQLIEQLAF